jgi:hypothetical protein
MAASAAVKQTCPPETCNEFALFARLPRTKLSRYRSKRLYYILIRRPRRCVSPARSLAPSSQPASRECFCSALVGRATQCACREYGTMQPAPLAARTSCIINTGESSRVFMDRRRRRNLPSPYYILPSLSAPAPVNKSMATLLPWRARQLAVTK